MSTAYLVTGVSRGIGWALLKALSSDPSNTVIGLVRNKPGTDKRVDEELSDRKNIHIVQGDLSDYESLKKSVPEVTKVTGGSLDYIIANAAFLSDWSGLRTIDQLAEYPKDLEEDTLMNFRVNVVGQIHLFNLYLPLILKGEAKKITAISSGMGDVDMAREHKIELGGPYAISKAGLNMAIAKFHSRYADQGVLFLSVCPGMVETGHTTELDEQTGKNFAKMVATFRSYAPNMKLFQPEESAEKVLTVIRKATVETHGGAAVSHKGNKEWL